MKTIYEEVLVLKAHISEVFLKKIISLYTREEQRNRGWRTPMIGLKPDE